MPDSASRITASSVCTALAGNAPAAVSPASMIASTPSSTALAASLTSARVGRAPVVIDSSTCVARITGTLKWRAAPGDFLLRPRHPLERHLEAEIAARHHHRVARLDDLVEMFERLRPFELGHQRHAAAAVLGQQLPRLPDIRRALDEAERDVVDAERQAELQVVDVLGGDRRTPAAARPGALIPLCSPSWPPSSDDRLQSRGRRSIRPAARSRRRPAAADRRARRCGPARRRWSRRGPVRRRNRRWRSSAARRRAAAAAGRPSSRPVRIFGPPRSCRIATSCPARFAALRTRS